MIRDGLVYRWNPKVATRTLDGTAFILINSNMVSLNPVASRIWDLCKDGSTLTDVVGAIVDEFDIAAEAAEADAVEFLEQLRSRGMLIASKHDVALDNRGQGELA